MLRKALEHGHEIGNHAMHHDLLPSDVGHPRDERGDQAGFTPCSFRPSYGWINLSVARGARSLGMTT